MVKILGPGDLGATGRPVGPPGSDPGATPREIASIGSTDRTTAVVSVVALLMSLYSIYETAIRGPDIAAYMAPTGQYASPFQNSNFEVVGLPITIINDGGRAGTVLGMELTVTNPRTKQSKHFQATSVGLWTMAAAQQQSLTPFAPVALAGKTSSSQNILFTTREGESVLQLFEDAGTYQFALTLDLAGGTPKSWLGLGDGKPPGVDFDMTLPVLDHRAFTTGTLPLVRPKS